MTRFWIGDKVVPKDKVNGRWKVLPGDPPYYIVGTAIQPPNSKMSYDLFSPDGMKYGWAFGEEIELYEEER